ncbi:PD40 domain-containing protein, partial [candidate division WOR-3 bacterium]|nr:PD40 domain-containing protein [candidate division WOR-3 bacterium]
MGKKNILSIILLFLLAGYGYAQWQPPVNLGENINTLVADNSCSISSDGNSLYFASFRTGGLGSADIWISEKDAGIWQGPVNLGDSINSSGLDFTPHISSDGNHLYFMSTISGGEG